MGYRMNSRDGGIRCVGSENTLGLNGQSKRGKCTRVLEM